MFPRFLRRLASTSDIKPQDTDFSSVANIESPLTQKIHEGIDHCQLVGDPDPALDKAELLQLAQKSPFFQALVTTLLDIQKQNHAAQDRIHSPQPRKDLLQEILSDTHHLCDDSERNFLGELILDLLAKQKGEPVTTEIVHDVPLVVWNNSIGKYEPIGVTAQSILRKKKVGKTAAMVIAGEGTGIMLHISDTDGSYSVDRFWHHRHPRSKIETKPSDLTNVAERTELNSAYDEISQLDVKMVNLLILLLQAVHATQLDVSNFHHT